MTDDLLPCPFCGGALDRDSDGALHGGDDCVLSQIYIFDTNLDEWNRRALPANTSAQCCMCGKRGLSTVEGDGGTECELPDGRLTCSHDCWDRATSPAPDTGDKLREAARVLLDEVLDNCGTDVGAWVPILSAMSARTGGSLNQSMNALVAALRAIAAYQSAKDKTC